jgi:hypothetical protein
MAKIKLLISSLPNVGKTTLLQTLKNVLVIARDGKKYPFPQAHVNVPDFTSADELIDLISEKIHAYKEKMGNMPETVVIDSISKILLDIEGYCLEKIASFPYGKINTEIKKVVDFIERDLAPSFNVVLVSHAMYDEKVNGYALVNAGGSYGKKGGILSEVDEAIFLESRTKKRFIHYRNPNMASRTTVADLPDTGPAEDFNLQEHLAMLQKRQNKATEWSL